MLNDSKLFMVFVCEQDEAYTLFFGSSNWYLFLRLHAILCDRLYSMYDQAKILLGEEMLHRNNRRESTATALRLKPKSDTKIEDYYPTFIDMLKNLLDGNMETNTYEDSLREMFGIHAYLAFTLDRVSFVCACCGETGVLMTLQCSPSRLGCNQCCTSVAARRHRTRCNRMRGIVPSATQKERSGRLVQNGTATVVCGANISTARRSHTAR